MASNLCEPKMARLRTPWDWLSHIISLRLFCTPRTHMKILNLFIYILLKHHLCRLSNSMVYYGVLLSVGVLGGSLYLNFFLTSIIDIPSNFFAIWFMGWYVLLKRCHVNSRGLTKGPYGVDGHNPSYIWSPLFCPLTPLTWPSWRIEWGSWIQVIDIKSFSIFRLPGWPTDVNSRMVIKDSANQTTQEACIACASLRFLCI